MATGPPQRDFPAVSVVVCGRDGAHHLPALLEALAGQTAPRSSFEVVYVDDASSDDSIAVVERSDLAAAVVRAPEAVGLPRARNLGIAASRGPILALTDVDTRPDPDWVARGIARFDDPAVEYLAGGITVPVGPTATIAAMVDATTFLDQQMYVRDGFSAGANIWVRRETAERVGGFNEALGPYGGDDDEFGWRLAAAGVGVVYGPEVHLCHPPRARLRDVARKAYTLGASQATRRRMATGHLAGQTPRFLEPRAYLPPRRIPRLERIAALDPQPTVPQLLLMYVARYVCVQLATLAGEAAGEVSRRRPTRRE
jgi:GT2 family glycosyltransferase